MTPPPACQLHPPPPVLCHQPALFVYLLASPAQAPHPCWTELPAQACAHREMALGELRQELAALLAAVQLLKEDNSGRKIAEIQGKLATVPVPPPGPTMVAEP